MKSCCSLFLIIMVLCGLWLPSKAQEKPKNKDEGKYEGLFTKRPMIVERDRPEKWKQLVSGGQFMDLLSPMPVQGKLTRNTWGGENVLPRYIDNGIEDKKWSYWGGNSLLGKDGKYHLIVCRWLESEAKGHGYYPWSDVVHATSKNAFGPYKVDQTLFPGHNPHLMQLKDGRYFIKSGLKFWVETADPGKSSLPSIKGLSKYWEEVPLKLNNRERVKREQAPMAFALREDGSFLMLTRHGDMYVSQTGLSTYHRITENRVFPAIEGRFEDPVIWRDNIQYHLIMNDWQGRIAYHMRSKDGLHWKLDDGVAYEPGIGVTEDGIVNNWAKYEVIRIGQDAYGRAVRVNFAVIDCPKKEDLGGDIHSSKVVFFPLIKGRLLSVLNDERITMCTNEIEVKIEAEDGFDPNTDLDLSSLKFGVSEEVNFGRGCPLIETRKDGKDLILIFDASNNKFTKEHFAGKLLGRSKDGKLCYGYSRLPGVNYLEPALSALPPKFTPIEGGVKIEVEVQNFGQVKSEVTPLKVIVGSTGNLEVIQGKIPALNPYEKTIVEMRRMETRTKFEKGRPSVVTVQIEPSDCEPERLTREIKIY